MKAYENDYEKNNLNNQTTEVVSFNTPSNTSSDEKISFVTKEVGLSKEEEQILLNAEIDNKIKTNKRAIHTLVWLVMFEFVIVLLG